MSTTIEQKVVEMRFDNQNFERNVSQSMSTLDKLKQTIDNTTSGAAFDNLGKAANRLDFSGITTSIQTMTQTFSVWEQMAIGAIRRVGASIEQFVTSKVDQMSFAQMRAGWSKYEDFTTSEQTIMSALSDEGFKDDAEKLAYVEKYLEKLNWFSDETSYSLTEMTSNVGKFIANGVKIEDATEAMMGISTWAAASGQNTQAAARAMYNLSQSMAMGYVATKDWLSIENANMATAQFKELAIAIAEAQGKQLEFIKNQKTGEKVIVSPENFRETLQYKWLDNDVLTSTLKEYSSFTQAVYEVTQNTDFEATEVIGYLKRARSEAKKTGRSLEEIAKEKYGIDLYVTDEATGKVHSLMDGVSDLAIKALAAAQEAKTMGEAFDATADATSTKWMGVYKALFGNYLEAKKIWTDFSMFMWDMFASPIESLRQALLDWKDSGGRELLFGIFDEEGEVEVNGFFYNLADTIKTFKDAVTEGLKDAKAQLTGFKLLLFTDELKRASDKILEFSKTAAPYLEKAVSVIVSTLKNGFKAISNLFARLNPIQKAIGVVWSLIQSIANGFRKIFDFQQFKSTFGSIYTYLSDSLVGLVKGFSLSENAMAKFSKIGETVAKVLNAIRRVGESVSQVIQNLVNRGAFTKIGEFLSGPAIELLMIIPNTIADIISAIADFLANNETAFDAMVLIFTTIGETITFLIDVIGKFVEALDELGVFDAVGNTLKTVGEEFKQFLDEMGWLDKLQTWFKDATPAVQNFFDGLKKDITTSGIVDLLKNTFADVEKGFNSVYSFLTGWFKELGINVFVSEDASAFAKMAQIVIGLVQVVIGAVKSAHKAIKEFVDSDENVKKFVDDAKAGIADFFHTTVDAEGNEETFFDKLVKGIYWVLDKLKYVVGAVMYVGKAIGDLFSGSGNGEGIFSKIVGFIKGLFGGKKGKESVEEAAQENSVKEAVVVLEDALDEDSFNVFGDMIVNTSDSLEKVGKAAEDLDKNVFQKFFSEDGNFQDIMVQLKDLSKFLAENIFLIMFYINQMSKRAQELMVAKGFLEVAIGVRNVMNGAAKVEKAAASFINAKAFKKKIDAIGDVIRSLAVSVAIVVGAIASMAILEKSGVSLHKQTEFVSRLLAGIMIFMVVMTALAKAKDKEGMQSIGQYFQGVGSVLMGLAAMIASIVGSCIAITLIADGKTDTVFAAMFMMTLLIATIGLFIKWVSGIQEKDTKPLLKASAALIPAAIAVGMIASAMSLVIAASAIPNASMVGSIFAMITILGGVGALLWALVEFTKDADGKKLLQASVAMLAIGAAVTALAYAMVILSTVAGLNPGGLLVAAIALIPIVAVLIILSESVKALAEKFSGKMVGAIATLIAMTYVIAAIAAIVVALSMIPGQLLLSGIIYTSLIIALVALMATIGEKGGANLVATVAAFSLLVVAISGLVYVLGLLSQIKTDDLEKVVTAFGWILAFVGILGLAVGGVLGSIPAASVALAAFAGVLLGLGAMLLMAGAGFKMFIDTLILMNDKSGEIDGGVNKLGEIFDKFMDKMFGWIPKLAAVVGAIIVAIATELKKKAAVIGDALIKGLITVLGVLQANLHTIWEHLKQIAVASVEPIVQIIVGIIKELWRIFQEWIGPAWQKVKDWVREKIWDPIVEWWNNFTQPFKDAFDNVKKWFEDVKQKVKDKWEGIKKWWTDIWEKIKDKAEKFAQPFKDAWKTIKDWWNDNVQPKIDWFKQTISDLVNWVKEKAEALGAAFGQGGKEGLQKNTKAMEIAAGIAAEKTTDAVAEKWKVHSPSKVAEKLGGFFDLGLVKGLIGGIPGIENAGGQIGDSLSGALSGALGNATTILEDGIAPTITPVLDLSNIENGVGDINGILSGATDEYAINSAGFSMIDPNHFFDGTNVLNSNFDITQAIGALRGKFDNLLEKLGGLRVVMDSGALVGELVDPMDQALGKKSVYTGRGVYAK